MVNPTTIILALVIGSVICAPSEISKKYEEFDIVPEIIPAAPPAKIDVKYGGDLIVDFGNELTPKEVHEKPTVSYDAEDGAYYTLIMVDTDIPPQVGGKEFQHWVVVNIPGSDISKGETLFNYYGAGPPRGSGIHRYIFLVYKQEKKMEKAQYADVQDSTLKSRLSYLLKDLEKKFELRNPIAGNFFRSQYDNNVPKYSAERRKMFEKM